MHDFGRWRPELRSSSFVRVSGRGPPSRPLTRYGWLMLFSSFWISTSTPCSISSSTSGGSLGSRGAVSKSPERIVLFGDVVLRKSTTKTLWMLHAPPMYFRSKSTIQRDIVKKPPTETCEVYD